MDKDELNVEDKDILKYFISVDISDVSQSYDVHLFISRVFRQLDQIDSIDKLEKVGVICKICYIIEVNPEYIEQIRPYIFRLILIFLREYICDECICSSLLRGLAVIISSFNMESHDFAIKLIDESRKLDIGNILTDVLVEGSDKVKKLCIDCLSCIFQLENILLKSDMINETLFDAISSIIDTHLCKDIYVLINFIVSESYEIKYISFNGESCEEIYDTNKTYLMLNALLDHIVQGIFMEDCYIAQLCYDSLLKISSYDPGGIHSLVLRNNKIIQRLSKTLLSSNEILVIKSIYFLDLLITFPDENIFDSIKENDIIEIYFNLLCNGSLNIVRHLVVMFETWLNVQISDIRMDILSRFCRLEFYATFGNKILSIKEEIWKLIEYVMSLYQVNMYNILYCRELFLFLCDLLICDSLIHLSVKVINIILEITNAKILGGFETLYINIFNENGVFDYLQNIMESEPNLLSQNELHSISMFLDTCKSQMNVNN